MSSGKVLLARLGLISDVFVDWYNLMLLFCTLYFSSSLGHFGSLHKIQEVDDADASATCINIPDNNSASLVVSFMATPPTH